MRRKWVSMALALTMLGSTVTAVGAEDEKVTLTVYTWFQGGEQEAADALAAKYESEHSNVDIEMNHIAYDDYNSKLNTVLASGTSDSVPDIFYVDGQNAKDFGLNGVATDLAPLYAEDDLDPKELYTDSALFYTGDNLWAISGNLTTVVLYYNKEMFEEAGITPPSTDASNPWTWDEYVDAATKLTKDVNGLTPNDEGFDENSIAVYGTLMTSSTSWITMEGLLYSNNSGFVNADGTELAIDDPEGIEVVQAIADLSSKYHCAPTVGQSKAIQRASAMLMNGQLGMFMEGAYIYPEFADESYDVGVTAQPMFQTPSGMAMGAAWMMSSQTKHPEEAADFFEALTDYSYQVAACEEAGISVPNFPATKADYADEDAIANWAKNYNPDMAEVATGLIGGVAKMSESGSLKNFTKIVDQTILPGLDKLWLGECTAEEAVAPLADQCADFLEGNW